MLLNEIFPRYGSVLELLTDNGSENVNKVMRETLKSLNIHYVTTSYYHPATNGRVERSHRTMNDILAKQIRDNHNSWDIWLPQTLAAIRFSVSLSTNRIPFYLFVTF